MTQENLLSTTAARIVWLPFRLFGRKAFVPPQKTLILQPCCLSHVMLTTPLLTMMSSTYPDARFDWAISDTSRQAISGNPRLTELVRTSHHYLEDASRAEIQALIQRLRQEAYDTCIIPNRSSLLAWIAWRAKIPQRIGLSAGGRGFSHTFAVKYPPGEVHEAAVYLEIAKAMGINLGQGERIPMEFYPPDLDRTAVTQRLIDELNWLGDRPLVIIHPGGGDGTGLIDGRKQWPPERFVLLSNHIVRKHNAQIILVGGEQDQSIVTAIAGMMFAQAGNWAGQFSLGSLGALAEIADLYIGNDTGPTHIAAAVGCPTLAIFGPSNPAISGPYGRKEKVITLWHNLPQQTFTWDNGITVEEAALAADKLLTRLT